MAPITAPVINSQTLQMRHPNFAGTMTNFVTHNTLKEDVLEKLYNKVALHAKTNAGGRPGQCYQGTRMTVTGEIDGFIQGGGGHKEQMMWLSGPAGAGKSTIIQTVAERCNKGNVPTASFYFCHRDETRNHAKNLVVTLLYQFFAFCPKLKQFVRDRISRDSLVLEAPVQDQFERLLSLPPHGVQHSAIVLLIDGLDECANDEQEQVLLALHNLTAQEHSPFIILVSSRDEYRLRMAFSRLGPSVTSTFLDEQYMPRDDIRSFVVGKFRDIRNLRPNVRDDDWPSHDAMAAIVAKSSGQFLYAAEVMRYIEDSPAIPTLSLAWIQGALPSENHFPLTQLDSIFSSIVSRAEHLDSVKQILAVHFLTYHSHQYAQRQLPFVETLNKYNPRYTHHVIELYIADLSSIIKVVQCQDTRQLLHLTFYHESLGDYLLDESRSGTHHINVDVFAVELASVLQDPVSFSIGVSSLGRIRCSSPGLEKSLLAFGNRRRVLDYPNRQLTALWTEAIFHIHRIVRGITTKTRSDIDIYKYWNRDNSLYKRILRSWIRFAYLNGIGVHGIRYPYYRKYAIMEGIAFWVSKLWRRQ